MSYQSIVDSHLAQFAHKRGAPHAVCAVCRDGKLLAVASQSGEGFDELVEPAGTSFRIASMTKSFAAAAILRLRDQGKLRIDDSVADYVPELRLTGQWQRVTVRQLLSMRSGLASADDPWADRKLSEPDSFINSALLNQAQFSIGPDEEYQYSNLGYMLVGRVISNVAGASALDYITEQFLQPLGMDDTGWNYAEAPSVPGYRRTASGIRAETVFHVESDLAVFAGICSTLRDLAKWIEFFTDAHRKEPSSRFGGVLAARSRREMERLQAVMHPLSSVDRVGNAMGYGYGLRGNFVGREWFVGHSGGLPGFGSHMSWSQTRRIGVIALGNVTYFRAIELCNAMWLAIQEESRRVTAPLVYGEELVVSRGRALVEAALRGAASLPAELFSYNVPLDEETEELWRQVRDALRDQRAEALEVRAERGFAGAIYGGGEPLVFFALAPAEGALIQKLGFYGEEG